ncbi:terminase small subunit [Streptomyces phage Celia]|uniref:Terminase small subunit n=1 Tax=Streptomyces phage Celia TaxID=2590946 RepID=A0A516KR91_9CAUD|nr:terminase small subunit [Streptomyces phage Celia]QDP44208.1 terminase small subunit [Streptomyces phage Celia]QFG10468.1 terminase small subunit [Streptomyces phage Urza]QJD50570.1 terminase small subunit [Streptomyces phage Itza]USH45840.1 terminase small subunit [Streptomyces phage VieEnRose]
MGTRGPVPNRSEDLARPRERKGGDAKAVTKGVARPTSVPNADRDWHPIARKVWDGAKASGQTDFYQASDWAILYSLCDDLSAFKKSKVRSAQMAQTLYSALGNLLLTEGDRRRAGIELNEPPDESEAASVVAIADYKKELGLQT